MANLWNQILYQPLVNLLIFFYNLFGGNLGFAIISLTALLRLALVPLTSSSLKSARKMQQLSPEIEALKTKFKDDKQGLAQAQLELFKVHGINPAAGCLPQIVQIVILITLFNAFSHTLSGSPDSFTKLNSTLYSPLKFSESKMLNTQFFGLDLSKPDAFHLPGVPFPIPGLLVILSALTQFISSKLMLPAAKKAQKRAEKTPESSDDMATAMQTQMLYMFPLMTLFIGVSFPSGLALYWLVFSVFSSLQQLQINQATPPPLPKQG